MDIVLKVKTTNEKQFMSQLEIACREIERGISKTAIKISIKPKVKPKAKQNG